MSKYHGITYKKSWKPNCKKGQHILDEVESIDDHYLYCDACGLMIHIKKIEKEKND